MSDAIYTGVSSDTRQLRPGEIFVALRGERFDGHDYLEEAAQRGAVAAIVSDRRRLPASLALPLIEVDDTLQALQRLAATYRQRMPVRTLAVTGSNGKTSTKDMIATLLAERFTTIKTEGNLNNHIGVPLSLLRIQPMHEVGVFEMGMNHPGELAPLAAMVAAEIGVITNVGPAHLEGMGDEDAVAREKAAVIDNLPAHGAAVLNADNRWTPFLRGRTRARVVTAGLAPDADVRAENIQRWEGGVAFELVLPAVAARVPVKLAAIGDHWISNALLAAAAARVLGLTPDEIAAGFAKVALPAMRMQVTAVNGVRWINDAYNANPDSMRAALRALAAWPCAGRRVAVLGDMLELGAQAEPLHRQIGVEAAAADLALLVTVGPLARFIAAAARARGMAAGAVVECEDVAGAAAALGDRLKAGDCVLLKASRGMKLEPLIEALAR
ncbi:MAG: UDP-N-acetylmuramoyl-tripeptide--D-alanyl-D-alanine ligase [Verrucomicrobia bacterium]|nr:UDP-N-acetylmuramoyl-tripeptide--D-alanyl-D-alanine ligase [Verrucomicrobiota bacterium]